MNRFKLAHLGKYGIWLLVCLVFTGCASNARYLKEGDKTPPPPELGISESDGTLSMTINYLIIPDGPGSWVKTAGWDEYVVTLRNLSNSPITIEKIRMIDSRGIYVERGADPEQLEKASEAMIAEYRDIGVTIAIGSVPTIVGGAAIAGGSLGAAAGAAALAPVAFIAAPAYYFGKKYAHQKDREAIQAKFNRRQLREGVTFTGNATHQGSIFYPIVPSPQSLVVEYRQGQEFSTLEVPLEKLAGLHIAD